ncbi:hypothetical protein ml_386 [Mollivirus sibericum]|uniref:hypothetical protein n=1 Tax=Mollivirus sibericum TaxID=1678078 RepID=UPI0006B2DD50|nr:hypothetical protein ml_386 [Mollivirus sibericum]ALD62188.1 hypothetical protein ml_386 [Mollivirus sibericum]
MSKSSVHYRKDVLEIPHGARKAIRSSLVNRNGQRLSYTNREPIQAMPEFIEDERDLSLDQDTSLFDDRADYDTEEEDEDEEDDGRGSLFEASILGGALPSVNNLPSFAQVAHDKSFFDDDGDTAFRPFDRQRPSGHVENAYRAQPARHWSGDRHNIAPKGRTVSFSLDSTDESRSVDGYSRHPEASGQHSVAPSRRLQSSPKYRHPAQHQESFQSFPRDSAYASEEDEDGDEDDDRGEVLYNEDGHVMGTTSWHGRQASQHNPRPSMAVNHKQTASNKAMYAQDRAETTNHRQPRWDQHPKAQPFQATPLAAPSKQSRQHVLADRLAEHIRFAKDASVATPPPSIETVPEPKAPAAAAVASPRAREEPDKVSKPSEADLLVASFIRALAEMKETTRRLEQHNVPRMPFWGCVISKQGATALPLDGLSTSTASDRSQEGAYFAADTYLRFVHLEPVPEHQRSLPKRLGVYFVDPDTSSISLMAMETHGTDGQPVVGRFSWSPPLPMAYAPLDPHDQTFADIEANNDDNDNIGHDEEHSSQEHQENGPSLSEPPVTRRQLSDDNQRFVVEAVQAIQVDDSAVDPQTVDRNSAIQQDVLVDVLEMTPSARSAFDQQDKARERAYSVANLLDQLAPKDGDKDSDVPSFLEDQEDQEGQQETAVPMEEAESRGAPYPIRDDGETARVLLVEAREDIQPKSDIAAPIDPQKYDDDNDDDDDEEGETLSDSSSDDDQDDDSEYEQEDDEDTGRGQAPSEKTNTSSSFLANLFSPIMGGMAQTESHGDRKARA